MALTDHERDALEALCNCSRSNKRHSAYCPAFTAIPRFKKAMEIVYRGLIERLARTERERDQYMREAQALQDQVDTLQDQVGEGAP